MPRRRKSAQPDRTRVAQFLAHILRESPLRQVELCQEALTVTSREDWFLWGMLQHALANGMVAGEVGGRAFSLERAITAYNAALQVLTDQTAPFESAVVCSNLAKAYRNRLLGDRGDNLERAIALYRRSLSVFGREGYSEEWVMTQNNLGNAYRDRVYGERADNLASAIACYEDVLGEVTPDAAPAIWSTAHGNLGRLYRERSSSGGQADDLERAIKYLKAALQIRQHIGPPEQLAATLDDLGLAYFQRTSGDPSDNLERAIDYFDASLRARGTLDPQHEVFFTLIRIGAAYAKRTRGDRAANLEREAVCLAQAAMLGPPNTPRDLQDNLRNAFVGLMRERPAPTSQPSAVQLQQRLGGFVAAPDLEASLHWLFKHPELLGEEPDNLLTDAIASAKDPTLAAEYLERQETLRRFRVLMEPGLLGPLFSEGPLTVLLRSRLSPLVTPLLGWTDLEELEAAVRSQPQVLDRNVTELLKTLARRPAPQSADADAEARLEAERWVLDQLAHMLTACGEQGIDRIMTSLQEGYSSEDLDELKWEVLFVYGHAMLGSADDVPRQERARQLFGLGLFTLNRRRGDRLRNHMMAIECFLHALELFDEKTEPVEWAETQFYLGSAYVRRIGPERAADIERAIACFEASRRIRRRDKHVAEWASTTHSLGLAYASRLLGDHSANIEQAISYFRAAREVRTRERFPIEWSITMYALGLTYLQRRRQDSGVTNAELAVACLKDALEVRTREAVGPRRWGLTHQALARAYLAWYDVGDEESLALDHAQRALEAFTQDTYPAEWAQTQQLLAQVTTRSPAATVDQLRSEATRLRAVADAIPAELEPIVHGNVCRQLGRLYARLGQWGAAADALSDAVAVTSTIIGASALRTTRHAELAAVPMLHVNTAIALARAAEEAPGDQRNALLIEAIVVAERGRARELREALDQQTVELRELANRAPELHAAYRTAAERLQTVEAAELQRTLETSPDAWVASYDEAREARTAFRDVVARIRAAPGFQDFLKEPGWSDVARVVGESGVPLAYLLTGTQGGSVILLALKDSDDTLEDDRAAGGVRVEALRADDFAAADLNKLLVGDVDLLSAQLAGDENALTAALDVALPLVGERLGGPLVRRLGELGIAQVCLVPCGRLGFLPWHAAQYQQHQPNGQTVPRRLLDDVSVAYTPSARVLGAARSRLQAATGHARGLVGVANPLPNPKPLPLAEVELHAVADIATAAGLQPVVPLYTEQATKRSLLDHVRAASHVHLACHGAFDPVRPLDSALQLAAGDQLTLWEILQGQMFTDTRLAVIAACQTATTDVLTVPDEMIGLPAGFLQAGAAGVIGTLWPVDDLATAFLMSRFYRYHLLGDSDLGTGPMAPPLALRSAQHDLAASTVADIKAFLDATPGTETDGPPTTAPSGGLPTVLRTQLMPLAGTAPAGAEQAEGAPAGTVWASIRPYQHPAYWAAFVVVGTWFERAGRIGRPR